MLLNFDYNDLENTARAVLKLNPSAREHFKTPADLAVFMRQMGETYLGAEGAGFFGTFGFYLSAFPTPGNKNMRTVRASVAASLIK